MLPLNLPSFDIKICDKNNKCKVFDLLRRKYIVLTPEEWVRQHFVNYLITVKNYPSSLMSNEVSLNFNGMQRRCDTVVYDRSLKPKIIIEYKAPNIHITQKVFDQISIYNLVLKVDFLIVSNGLQHFCCKMDYENNSYVFLNDIPTYTVIP